MKICLITANLPPRLCGVGDHTVRLANYFAERGDDVCVFTTADQNALIPGTKFSVKRPLRSWSIFSMPQLWRAIRDWQPDVILLQWVPFLYSKRGTNLALPGTLALLALRGANLQIMVHEPWVSFIRPSFFITGPIQRLALGLLIRCAKKISVSTEAWTQMLRNFFPGCRDNINTVPVVSNIAISPCDPTQVRRRAGIPEGALVIGAFSLHGAAKLFSMVDATWMKIAKQRADVHFVIFGADDPTVHREMPNLVGHPRCRFTGYLPANEISHWFQSVDILLAPFSDGMTTRRTSVISALAHGVPVVTTEGRLTDLRLFKPAPLVLSRIDEMSFYQETMKLVLDKSLRHDLGRRAKIFHSENFELSLVGEALIENGTVKCSRIN